MRRWLIGLLLFLPLVGWSHPVSLTWANVRINGDQITINFKVLLEDLIYFHHPEHDGQYNYSTEKLKSLTELHGEIIQDYFFITDTENNRISLAIKSIDTRDLQANKIGAMDLMRHSIRYQLVATLDDITWESLTFHQEFDKHDIGIPAVTFLTAYSAKEELIADIEVSPSQPFTLYASGHQEPINPSQLTSSYFSITSLGVRHELTLPYEQFVLLTGLSSQAFDEKATLSYFGGHNLISANGLDLTPELRSFTSLQSMTEGQLQPESLVYLDLYYPTDQSTETVNISWSDYNWKWRWFDSTILTMDSTYQHTFSRYQPTFLWEGKNIIIDQGK